jgi:hypothetical protein
MKIKKSDLIHLIREMAIDEMAYMGQPSMLTGETPEAHPGKVTKLSSIKRFFKSNVWHKKANKFFGEERGFPNSNVWIIPVIGDARVRVRKMPLDKRTGSSRGWAANIDLEYLANLDVDKDTLSKINPNNDIIILPSVDYLEVDFYPTPHMLIHALYDEGPLSRLDSVSSVIDAIDYSDGEVTSTATKALRSGLSQSEPDYAAEVLTAALIYKGGENLTTFPGRPEFSKMLEKAAQDSRAFLQGKIVYINIMINL